MMDSMKIMRVEKALKAGIEIDDPVYFDILEEEPEWKKIRNLRQEKDKLRKKEQN